MSEDEKSDTEDKEEAELGVMEDQRSIILHLISQLKLGMDLTKVSAPVSLSLQLVAGVPNPCTPQTFFAHVLFTLLNLGQQNGEDQAHCHGPILGI